MTPLTLALLLAAPPAAGWPDPLGDPPAASRAQWETERRPKLRAAFEREMYGTYPARPEALPAAVLHTDTLAFGGRATLTEVALTCAPGAPPVHWLVAVPNGRAPAAAFVGLNFTGNHTLVADPKVRLPDAGFRPERPRAGRNAHADAWPIELIISKGFAVATAYYGEVVPDDPKRTGGLSGVLRPEPGSPEGTGAVMAWAWGLARGADYLATVPGVDPKRLIAIGHSRLGKAALVSAAFDPVFSGVVASQAGCGGSAPSRSGDPKAESVARINASFPHWFCGSFKRYGADPSKLPFDQHGLVALCAPKRVLFTAATGDVWANPPGQLAVLNAARPAYKLYGHDEAAMDYPTEGTRVGGRLAFWVRAGKHAMTRADWEAYLAWAALAAD